MADLNSPIFLGDVTGGLHATKVEKLQNQSVASTAPEIAQALVWNGSAWAPATIPPVAGACWEFFEHFLAASPLAGNLLFGVTGGANTVTSVGFGAVAMSTGTGAATGQQARLNQSGNASLIGNSSARAIWRVSQASAVWFDATLTGAFRCGWGDSVTGESSNGIYFRSQNGQVIDFVTKTAGVETVTSTGVSFAQNVFRNLEILINAAGNEIVAKIDGTVVATHTTNISANRMFFFNHINRVSTTGTAVISNIDFVYCRVTPSTPFF